MFWSIFLRKAPVDLRKFQHMFTVKIPDWKDLCTGFIHLIYPSLCAGCGADLSNTQYCFCIRCQSKLQASEMHLKEENEFTARFWGRLPIESGAAMYYFSRKSPIQSALHYLKYRNQPEIGVRIGRRFGQMLSRSPYFQEIQAIVPVPLHPRKEHQRGYNQSAMLAKGLAEYIKAPIISDTLIRKNFSLSQTKKKRMERFENVEEVFGLKQAERLSGKHVLLIDDVLTTGATLEACGSVLLQIPGVKLSMATIAIAMHWSMNDTYTPR